MKRYEDYKDSGVEWIGEIPSGWRISTLKYHINLKGGYPFDSSDITNEEREFPIIRIGNVNTGQVDVFFDGIYSKKMTIVNNGDYIVSLTGDFRIRQWINESSLLNQRCGLLEVVSGVSNRFLFYTIPFEFSVLEKTKYYTTLKNLSNSEFLSIRFPLPPLHEQKEIVDYLDRKTSEIDRLITLTREKIQLLKERRTSLINQVVTKGLNPDVEMKDSGVEWIGKIPSHWVKTKNKYLLAEKVNLVNDKWKDFTLLSLSKKGVIKRDVESSKGKFPASFENYKSVEKGDLIFCLYDIQETPRTVGLSELDGMITGSYKIFESRNEETSKFIYYLYLNIDNFKGLKPHYTGLRNVVRPEVFGGLELFLPPLQEQKEIVDYLDRKTSEIDDMVTIEEQRIELLREYRQSLINEVVTGKRCVLQSSNQIPVT